MRFFSFFAFRADIWFPAEFTDHAFVNLTIKVILTQEATFAQPRFPEGPDFLVQLSLDRSYT